MNVGNSQNQMNSIGFRSGNQEGHNLKIALLYEIKPREFNWTQIWQFCGLILLTFLKNSLFSLKNPKVIHTE